MGDDLGSLVVAFKADLSGLESGADQAKKKLGEVDSSAKETGGGFLSMLKNAASFAAGMAVFHLAGDAVSFLKDQVLDTIQVEITHQQTLAQTVQALKSTHDASGETATSISDLADSLSQVTPFSADTIQSAENLTLTFTNIGKSVFPQATQAILDVSQAMGQDLKSSAIQVGKALGDPLTGMSALQRVGVTFSAEEKKEITVMMQHNDIIGAQKIMLHELSTEFGGSAVAAGKTFGGQMDILKNKLEDFKIKIGSAVIPMLTQLVGFVSNNVMPWLTKFSDWIFHYANPYLQQLSKWLGQANQAFNTLTTPVKKVQQALAPLTDSFDRASGLIQDTTKVTKPLTDAFDRAKGLIADTSTKGNSLSDSFDRAKTVTADMSNKFGDLNTQANPVLTLFQQLEPTVKDLIGDVETIAGDIETFAVNTVDAVTQSGALQAIFQTVHDILPDVIHFVGDTANAFETKLLPSVLSLVKNFSTWLDKSGILKDALNTLDGTVQTLAGWLGTAVGWLSDFFGWMNQNQAASTAFKGVLYAIGGVLAGIKIVDFGKSVFNTFTQAKQNVTDFMNSVGKIKDKLGDVLNFTKDTFMKGWNKVFGKGGDATNSADETGDSVSSIGDDAKNSAADVETSAKTEETALDNVATEAKGADVAVADIGTSAEASAGKVETASASEEVSIGEVTASAEGASVGVASIGPTATTAGSTAVAGLNPVSVLLAGVVGNSMAFGAVSGNNPIKAWQTGGIIGELEYVIALGTPGGQLANLLNTLQQIWNMLNSIGGPSGNPGYTPPAGGNYKGPKGWASGGDTGPGWFIAGDPGSSELVYAPGGAHVYNHHDTMGMLGGGVEIHVHNHHYWNGKEVTNLVMTEATAEVRRVGRNMR